MNKRGANRTLGAIIGAVIASQVTCATAQTAIRIPADSTAQVMTVSSSTPGVRPDTSIVRDVRRALRRVPEMDDSGIHIRVSRGVVTLTGTVPESWQISRAANAARSVLGVKSVSNRLTEKGHAADSDKPASE
jgi:hyperosmotically inducible periplasmic protein